MMMDGKMVNCVAIRRNIWTGAGKFDFLFNMMWIMLERTYIYPPYLLLYVSSDFTFGKGYCPVPQLGLVSDAL
jgi:hypothetical protein